MSRIYTTTLACGCMISADGHSAIPCPAGLSFPMEALTIEEQELHYKSWSEYNKSALRKVFKGDKHGYCAICCGPILDGHSWTLTGRMQRVHANPDRCIDVLHPEIREEFVKENPNWADMRDY